MTNDPRTDGGVAVTTREVHSRPYDVLEGLLLGLPTLFVLALVGFAALSLTGTPPVAGIAGLWLLSIPLGLLLAVAVPVLLYLDAKELGEHDLDWTPNPGLYAVLGFLFAGLTMLHYLYKRQEVVRDEAGGDRWWLLAVGAVAAPVLLGALASVTGEFALFTAGFALAFLLPVGVYKDAEHVRGRDAGWEPNPTMQFTVAYVCGFTVLLGVPYLGYYLYKRRSSVGLP
ncbi:hypothetical protein [Halorarum salinum]|uniref:Uncharacterized protein n=1 Tax=Halorarum salinum TaxID=2743089 RepID=A0A7D5QGG9_9EURY|nr:hypothetical protein [Halobaculum salinum]QLG61464.1 hypothetical protein HUG12_06835 [Halobaculum salinum]